jgi:hypothetical protein
VSEGTGDQQVQIIGFSRRDQNDLEQERSADQQVQIIGFSRRDQNDLG